MFIYHLMHKFCGFTELLSVHLQNFRTALHNCSDLLKINQWYSGKYTEIYKELELELCS